MTTTDQELLARYVREQSEPAFAEVVERQVDLVYSAALRLVAGEAALAEDITQKVFTDLARKAGSVARVGSVAGWLHTHTRFVALTAIRAESRRRVREQEAAIMQDPNPTPELDWTRLRPLLDEAVGELRSADRDAIIMRFFQNKSHREVGEALGLSENTARMRVERALEKLQTHFVRRGVSVSSAVIALAMSANSVHAAPVGLRAKVAGASLAGAGEFTFTISKFLVMSTKTKISLIAAMVVILAAVSLTRPYWRNSSTDEFTESSLPHAVPLVPGSHPLPAKVASPVMLPIPSATSSSIVSMEKSVSIPWSLNTYLASQDWKDVGADTPENALQTVYWARKSGNTERETQLMLTEPVIEAAADHPRPKNQGKTSTNQVEATLVDALNYDNLLGGKVVRSKVVSEDVVEMNVNEDWSDSAMIQEWFQFRKINGQWKYTQTITLAP